MNLFGDLAKAQSFEDGNKRSALFIANGLLIREGAMMPLTVPLDEGPAGGKSHRFNVLLARSYVFGEDRGLKRGLPHR